MLELLEYGNRPKVTYHAGDGEELVPAAKCAQRERINPRTLWRLTPVTPDNHVAPSHNFGEQSQSPSNSHAHLETICLRSVCGP